MTDKSLLAPDPIGKCAINWRLNSALLNGKCPHHPTPERFNRKHLSECPLVLNHPLYVATISSESFQINRSAVQSKLASSHYTVLDELLNCGQLEEFYTLFSTLAAKVLPLNNMDNDGPVVPL